MIAALSGSILHIGKNLIFLMVAGVGYRIYPTSAVLNAFHVGNEALIFIYTHVREDSLQLFGFLNVEELELFELLISVSGIGPKTALAIINKGVSEVEEAIIIADVGFFTSVPRLGTKNAQKIIIELKSKLGSVKELDLTETSSMDTPVIQALLAFGFSKQEVNTVISQIPKTANTLETKVKAALTFLGKHQ